jgi:hypothetical protein
MHNLFLSTLNESLPIIASGRKYPKPIFETEKMTDYILWLKKAPQHISSFGSHPALTAKISGA